MEHVAEGCTCKGKKCPKCETVKCVECFSIRKNGNRQSYCRKCSSAKRAKWVREHPEEMLEHNRKWRKNNPDRRKEIVQCYNQSPLAKEAQRRYKEAHPNKEAHPKGKEPGYWIKYEARYKEKRLQWRKNNPETLRVNHIRYRARKKSALGDFTVQEWEALKAQYDYTCLRCHCKEPEIKLTADHVMPLSKGGSNFIDNIQPLCQSCNFQKHTKFVDFRPKNP